MTDEYEKSVGLFSTGNSARSQMAEALVNARYGEQWQAASAGTEPAGTVHPYALRVLQEPGIEHQGRSKSAMEFADQPFGLVVTVCDDATQNCPFWPGQGRQAHLNLPDPAQATGSEEEILDVFRAVRDRLIDELPALLSKEQRGAEQQETMPKGLWVHPGHQAGTRLTGNKGRGRAARRDCSINR